MIPGPSVRLAQQQQSDAGNECGLLPVINLDAAFCKTASGVGGYGQSFLVCALDANKNIVTLLAGHGEVEDQENWEFMLGQMKKRYPRDFLNKMPKLPRMSYKRMEGCCSCRRGE